MEAESNALVERCPAPEHYADRAMSEYDTDFVLWSHQQADLLLQGSPAVPPRNGWNRTILEQRSQIRVLLEGSPSLAQLVSEAVRAELPSARELAHADLAEFSESAPGPSAELTFTDALPD